MRRDLHNTVWAMAVGLAMVAALWGAVLVIVDHNRAALRANAEVDAGNMARVFAEHVRRSVTMIDLALQDYRDFHRSDPQAAPSEGWRDAYLKEGGAFQRGVIDAQGMIRYSNLTPVTQPVDLSDREHFRVHRESGRDELFISRPVLGRVSQRWSLQFTRRLSNPDGSFAGVVVLSVEPDYFVANFEAIDTGPNGVTLLAGTDRVLRARFSRQSADAKGLGETLPESYPFFDPQRPAGVASVASFVDGIDRISGWRGVGGYPLVVAAQVADEDVLAQSRPVERSLAIVGALVTAVLLAGAAGAGHLLERRERAQRQLSRHAEELHQANEEIERFAYVAAHDLQEPLRAITSYSQLVAATHGPSLDDEGREWLAEVVSGATRMKLLLRDIQFYLAEKALPLPEAPTPADAALAAALAKLAPAVAASAAEIDAQPLPALAADARRLTEIFTVLLANALQYRAPGRVPHVRIQARRDGGFDVIDVIDNGIGIEPQYVERIFEVFQRLHGRGEHPGTGMGLAIVRKMAQRLGGHVEVASIPGAGSTFSLHLPTTLHEANDEQRGRQALHHPAGGRRPGGRHAGQARAEAGADSV
ncbi:sensor histidine kinase [Azospirillum sp. TSO22-1]|uniref:sensor histidine kinase n=1 Tax=Azospirillum sp. TSO22-1 TaxID=716789 RepID=UPI0011B67BD8|nr:sensor histidine kinase [Azospirillum sp. TSO22-1]